VLPGFIKMADGNLCDNIQSTITTEAKCQKAGKELRLSWAKSYNKAGSFPGCFFANDGRSKVYFNESPKASKTVTNAKYAAICQVM